MSNQQCTGSLQSQVHYYEATLKEKYPHGYKLIIDEANKYAKRNYGRLTKFFKSYDQLLIEYYNKH